MEPMAPLALLAISVLTIIFGLLVITLPLSVYLIQRNTHRMLTELKALRGELESLNLKTHQLLESADRMEHQRLGPHQP